MFSQRLTTMLSDKLGIILEDTTQDVEKATSDLLDMATTLQDAMSQHKKALEDAQMQLDSIIERFNTKLGWEIRRRQPKLMVSHQKGCCNAGYYSQQLSFKPDLSNKCWNVDGEASRQFRRQFPDVLTLTSNTDSLADAVINFYKNRFKTLA